MPPNIGHGKICYLILPAVDAEASSAFYEKVFGWNMATEITAVMRDPAGNTFGVYQDPNLKRRS